MDLVPVLYVVLLGLCIDMYPLLCTLQVHMLVLYITLLVTMQGIISVKKVRCLFCKRNVETKNDSISNGTLSEYRVPVFVLRRTGVPLGWVSVDSILVVF
jgi:hypothetical protein